MINLRTFQFEIKTQSSGVRYGYLAFKEMFCIGNDNGFNNIVCTLYLKIHKLLSYSVGVHLDQDIGHQLI